MGMKTHHKNQNNSRKRQPRAVSIKIHINPQNANLWMCNTALLLEEVAQELRKGKAVTRIYNQQNQPVGSLYLYT